MVKNFFKDKKLFDFKLHITILVISVISLAIGIINVNLINGFSFIILPIIYSLFIAILFYILKPIKWINKKQSEASTIIILIIIGPLIAKLAIASGQNIDLLLNVGPALLLEELGDLGAVFIGLPIALILGFKRESIGMTSSICREPQIAVIIDKYGMESDEVKGFFIVYLIGIVLGTVFVTFIVNVLTFILPLHPYSYALASGIGSTSMNVAIMSSLSVLYPTLTNELLAFSGISTLISAVFGIYVYMFISLPLTEKLYNRFKH